MVLETKLVSFKKFCTWLALVQTLWYDKEIYPCNFIGPITVPFSFLILYLIINIAKLYIYIYIYILGGWGWCYAWLGFTWAGLGFLTNEFINDDKEVMVSNLVELISKLSKC